MEYVTTSPMTANQILEKASEILTSRYQRGSAFTSPQESQTYLKHKLRHHEREVFAVLFLDNQHRLIEYRELFYGTIDSATVHPREAVKAALELNAAAVILSHNHPSGLSEPSQADRRITQRIKDALSLVEVRVLDHIVVGDDLTSFAERGWL